MLQRRGLRQRQLARAWPEGAADGAAAVVRGGGGRRFCARPGIARQDARAQAQRQNLGLHDARALTFVAEAGGNANAWATFMRGHIWNASTSLLSRGGGPGARTTSLKLLLHKTSTGTGTGTCTNAGIGTSKGISGLVVDVNTAEALPQDLSVLLYDSTGLPPHSFSYFRYAPDTGAKEALPATLAKQPLQKWLGQGNAERVQVHVRVASDPPPSATRLKFT